MKEKSNRRKRAGQFAAIILVIALASCLLPIGRNSPLNAYTASQRQSLKADDLSVSRERILKAAAAHVKRANQVGYGYNRVMNGSSYLPLASSSQGFCCVDLITHVVYTATASTISGSYHSIEETLASAHAFSVSNGLVFNTQTVSVLKSQLQGIPDLYTSLGAGVDPASLMLGDIVLMGDRNSSTLNHSVMVLGRITAAENAYMMIPGFNANTSYFTNMSSVTGATYQSTDRFNKAWSSGDPNKGYFIKAAYRPRFAIRQQDLGGFRLKKTNAAGAGLAGAEFQLTYPNGSSQEIVMASSSYESGKIYQPGLYSLRETKAPAGCVLDPGERPLTIGMDGINSVYWDSPIQNETDEGRVRILKKDARTGNAIPGAVFDISQSSSFPAGTTQRLTTGSDGIAVSSGLPVSAGGRAYIREISVPAPYLLDSRVWTVNLVRGQTVSLEVANERARGQIEVVKKDDLGQPVQGAQFKVEDDQGTLVDQLTTAADGRAVTDPLPLGTYRLTETYVPPPYILDTDPREVTLSYRNQTTPVVQAAVSWTNRTVRGKIRLKKTDSSTGQPLEGAVFELLDEKGNPALDYLGEPVPLLISDEEGQALTPDLRQGSYSLREVEAPQAYYLNESSYPVAVMENETTYFVEVQNERVMVYIRVRKFDSHTLLPLAGARFQILEDTAGQEGVRQVRSAAQGILEELVTDAEGQARTSRPLPVGNYRLVEIAPPPGYSSGEDLDFYIGRNSDCIILDGSYKALDLQAGNQPVQLEFSKKTLTGEEELPGAHLALIDQETGTMLDDWVSGHSPHTISCLLVGKTYCLREIEAPPGYALSEDMVFTVKDTESVQTIEMRDGPTRVVLQKQDGDTKEPLSNVGFEIRDEEGRPIEFVRKADGVYLWKALSTQGDTESLVTSAQGRVTIRGLPAGTYTLVETQVPQGYLRPEKPSVLTVAAGASEESPCLFCLGNKKASLTIRKVDAATNRSLEGAVLDLFNEKGGKIQSGRTDSRGLLTFTGLSPGDYTVREADAPQAYQKSDEQLKISIDEYGQTQGELVFKNTPEGAPPTGESPLAYILGPAFIALAGLIILLLFFLQRRRTKA